MERSWKVALPAPPPLPPPVGMCAEFVTPQEYDSTSTSSLCLASRDSPLMSPIFAKMSAAMEHLKRFNVRLTAGRITNAAEESRNCDLFGVNGSTSVDPSSAASVDHRRSVNDFDFARSSLCR